MIYKSVKVGVMTLFVLNGLLFSFVVPYFLIKNFKIIYLIPLAMASIGAYVYLTETCKLIKKMIVKLNDKLH